MPTIRVPRPRALVTAWLGRLVQWRIRRKGLDLSELTILPESVRLPLLRNGTDPAPSSPRRARGARCSGARCRCRSGSASTW